MGQIDKVFGDDKTLKELQQTCKTKLCKELSGTCAAELCPLELDIEEYHDMAQAIFAVKKHGRRQDAAHTGDFIQVVLQKVDGSLCGYRLQRMMRDTTRLGFTMETSRILVFVLWQRPLR